MSTREVERGGVGIGRGASDFASMYSKRER